MIENGSTITSTSGAITLTGEYSSTGNGIRTQYGTNTIGGADPAAEMRAATAAFRPILERSEREG